MKCWGCYECSKNVIIEEASSMFGMPITRAMTHMICCPNCGNKRCPHATDHRLACTGSNDPGQVGSRYGVYPHPNKELFDFLDKKPII